MTPLLNRLRDGSFLFFLLPVGYFLLYGSYGWADTDQGFVPALAWRVIHGEVPYIDFCYVRPPLSPYLHSLELLILPREIQVLGMRLVYEVMLWASVFWGMRAVVQQLPSTTQMGLGNSQWWLASLAFLFAAHNFPAMPWHTIDGIFFGALGIWLVTHPRAGWRAVLGLLALTLSGLAKQPFGLMLPVGIVALFGLHTRGVALRIAAAAGATLLVLGTCAIWLLLPRGFLTAMLAQTAGASGLRELWDVGVVGYLWPGAAIFAGIAGLWWALRAHPALRRWLAWAVLLGLAVGYPAALAFWAHHKAIFIPPKFGVYHALWIGGLVHGIWLWRSGERPAAVASLLLTTMSWASGLSWGYTFPAQFVVPGWLGLQALLFSGERSGAAYFSPRLAAAVVLCAGLGFFFLNRFPYRDGPRSTMVVGAGDVFGPLRYIHTSPENLDKLQEYSSLRQQFPDAAVLPAMPGADYLAGLEPALPIDWEHDAEIGQSRMTEVLDLLETPGRVVLVETARLTEANSPNLRYRCSLLSVVLKTWLPGYQGRHFQVFTCPTKPFPN